jgi:hypothetical protein
MNGSIPYDPYAECSCGHIGAFDIGGDYLCEICILELDKEYSNEEEEEDE